MFVPKTLGKRFCFDYNLIPDFSAYFAKNLHGKNAWGCDVMMEVHVRRGRGGHIGKNCTNKAQCRQSATVSPSEAIFVIRPSRIMYASPRSSSRSPSMKR